MKITEKNIDEAYKKSLRITHNKGFHIKFKNGWVVSVQIGWGNYCDSYNYPVTDARDIGKFGYASDTAELWSWNNDKSEYYPDDPLGYQTPEDILKFMNEVSQK